MEDFVTWVDSSKIKQHVMNYNDEVLEPPVYFIVIKAFWF